MRMEQYRLEAICSVFSARVILYDSGGLSHGEYAFRYEDYMGIKNRDRMLAENISRQLFLKEVILPVDNLKNIIKTTLRAGFENWKNIQL